MFTSPNVSEPFQIAAIPAPRVRVSDRWWKEATHMPPVEKQFCEPLTLKAHAMGLSWFETVS
jgi:hypothetical protein